jgi:hypothetical protein
MACLVAGLEAPARHALRLAPNPADDENPSTWRKMMGAQNKTAKRRAERREAMWPDSEDRVWPQANGWFKAPRILPVAMLILDQVVGKGKDLTRTYLDLLARNWNEGFVDVTDEAQAAFLAGFKTERGRRTWTGYVKLLAKHGFIETKAVGTHKLGAILMVDPLRAVSQLKVDGKVSDDLWQLLLHTCDVYSMKQPDLSNLKPTPAEKKPEAKKKKGKPGEAA